MIHYHTLNKMLRELQIVGQHLGEVEYSAAAYELEEVWKQLQVVGREIDKVKELLRATPYRAE